MNGKTGTYLATALALTVAATAAVANDFYVAPRGTKGGDGSRGNPLDLAVALGTNSPAGPGDTVWVLPGQYDGGGGTNAAAPRSLAVSLSGAAGKPIRIQAAGGGPAVLFGSLAINGSHLEVIGLEIGDVNWKTTGGTVRGPVVSVGSTHGVSLINCNVFGGGDNGAIDVGDPAVDFQMYGCLVHDFGRLTVSPLPMATEDISIAQGGAGPGVTMSNREGTKRFEQNVVYRGCRGNFESVSGAVGYDFIENISYLSKSYVAGESFDSFLIAANYGKVQTPMDRIRFNGNLAYQPVDISAWRGNLRLVSYAPIVNGTAEVRDNVIIGAANGVMLDHWTKMTFTSNVVWATQRLLDVAGVKTAGEIKDWAVDRNTWFDNGAAKPFRVPGASTFEAWQKLGFDPNGRWITGHGGRPTGTVVRVFANRREPGRAEIGVFNFDDRADVAVDLSAALQSGTKFRVYNLLDVHTTLGSASPVIEGVYRGGAVKLPMQRSPASPEFEAFLLVPAAGR